jgi:hypothetical protein
MKPAPPVTKIMGKVNYRASLKMLTGLKFSCFWHQGHPETALSGGALKPFSHVVNQATSFRALPPGGASRMTRKSPSGLGGSEINHDFER